MKMNNLHDKTTTATSFASALFATLASFGVKPELFGLLAALSIAATGFYTNK